MSLAEGSDGAPRCWWAVGDAVYQAYHDEEWGRPELDDRALFAKLVLEGFQAGLAWITVLRKRERFREVFLGFDPSSVAAMGAADVERLLTDPGIIRHRAKIEAAIHNAGRALELIEEHGSLGRFLWRYGEGASAPPEELRSTSAASHALAADLKRRGWRYVGPTTLYAFMQAMGLVNDHVAGCVVRDQVEAERRPVLATFGI